jgi:hypothetical protein
MLNFNIPVDPKKEEQRQRQKRMEERIKNPKVNPTNKDIQEQLNDLTSLLLDK